MGGYGLRFVVVLLHFFPKTRGPNWVRIIRIVLHFEVYLGVPLLVETTQCFSVCSFLPFAFIPHVMGLCAASSWLFFGKLFYSC